MRRLMSILAVAVLVITGCGSKAEENASGGAGFPVTIEHKYGSTSIKSEPKRIVTVGLKEQDDLVALGIKPVGVTQWLDQIPTGFGPWAKDAFDKAQGESAQPTVLPSGDKTDFEGIAKLRPDLILALYSGLSQQEYDTLSKIAPVVAQPGNAPDFGIGWRAELDTVGKAVGRSEQAQRIADDIDAKFGEIRQKHPEFAGKSGLVATTYEGYFVYGREDPRTKVLADLGLRIPAELDKVMGDKFGANISKERTDLLNRDALVWIVSGFAAGEKTLAGDPLYSRMPVSREGRAVLVDNESTYGAALSFVTALSLPYQLERLVPQLSSAVDGDPRSVVARIRD